MNNTYKDVYKIEINNTELEDDMLFGDIYLVNVLDKFCISAKREAVDEGFKMRSFADLLDKESFIFLKEYLFSYYGIVWGIRKR